MSSLSRRYRHWQFSTELPLVVFDELHKSPKWKNWIKGIYDKRPGARFENLVATHLLKRLQFLEDKTGDRLALNYLRDRDQREVDFVITKKKEVVELIEVKYSDEAPSASLRHYAKVLKPKRAVQIVYTLERGFTKDGVEVLSPIDYFASPPWAT